MEGRGRFAFPTHSNICSSFAVFAPRTCGAVGLDRFKSLLGFAPHWVFEELLRWRQNKVKANLQNNTCALKQIPIITSKFSLSNHHTVLKCGFMRNRQGVGFYLMKKPSFIIYCLPTDCSNTLCSLSLPNILSHVVSVPFDSSAFAAQLSPLPLSGSVWNLPSGLRKQNGEQRGREGKRRAREMGMFATRHFLHVMPSLSLFCTGLCIYSDTLGNSPKLSL